MNTNEQKIAQRLQMGLAAPLGVLLVASVIFVRVVNGSQVALRFALFQVPALIVAAFIGRALSRRFLIRLGQLRRGSERLEQGHFEPLPIDKDEDEFTDLARAFNHMSKVIAVREATQRDQNNALADLNRRMETVLNATNDGIALLDSDGRFSLVNRRFGEMLGVRPEALLYQPLSEAQALLTSRLAHPERLMGRLGSFTEQDLIHPIGVTEEVIEVVGAERRFIQVYTAPVRDEHRYVTGRILALHDITRETEVDKMKTEFISVVSHELRTPLTSIKGYTDLLLSGQTGEINELQREFLGILQSSANRLNNLINDILDISRLESGRIEVKMERVDYEKIVVDVLRLMKASADEKEMSFDASFPSDCPTVRGDADKITQVLTNLINNAIKYTPRGGWVKVSLEITGDASITTCIADSGIGISHEDQKKLFQKFFRADNSLTREAGGTGLGLAIVKTTIELLGGGIWVESETGEGSRFYFTLPLYSESKVGASAAGSGGSDLDELFAIASDIPELESKPSGLLDRGLGLVLLVDDDVFMREHLMHSLHRMGYGVIAASNMDDVLLRARVHRPEVILLDIMMLPEMVGFQIQKALYADPTTSSLPIIAYSLSGDPVHGSLSLGAFSFMRKPVNPQLLVKSLREHLGKRDLSALSVILGDRDSSEMTAVQNAQYLREELMRQRISLMPATSATRAISLAIERRPDVILLDSGDNNESVSKEMFDLLKVLKSEEDMSHIPLIVLTDDVAEDVLHFHLGTDGGEMPVAMDYLSEQISRVVRDKVVKSASQRVIDENTSSPIGLLEPINKEERIDHVR